MGDDRELEMQVVQTEVCCKYKLHPGFRRLDIE